MFSVTNLVIANIIGAGIFTTTGYLGQILDHPFILLILWIIGGLVAICGAFAFGELGATFPEAGGEYTFISKLFHPLPGFLSGWLSLIVGFSAPIAASAMGCSKYLIWAFPKVQSLLFLENTLSAQWFYKWLAVAIILLFTFIHSRGIVLGAKIQNILTVLKVLMVFGLIVAGFWIGKGNFDSFAEINKFQFNFNGWKSMGLALMLVMFAYSGWNSSTYIGSEIRNPAKVITQSLLISVGIVIVLYFFLNLFFIYAIPFEKIVGEPEIAGLAASFAFGNVAGSIISVFIAFALFSSLSAFILLGPRVYYSMAQKGYFFKRFAKVNPKSKVPTASILLQSSVAIALVVSGTFEQILVYMGFSLGIFPILAVIGVFKIRKKGISKLQLPGFPYLHIFFIAVSSSILVLAFFERPMESSIALLTALSGIPFYFWFKRKNQVN